MNEHLESAVEKFSALEEYTSTHVEKLMAQGMQELARALDSIDQRLIRLEETMREAD